MELGPIVQWTAFVVFAFVAVAGALGMTTTMSMFRSGVFLMASFVGVAGLFLLLLADLLALLQVMMYVGGMLVMILFMVLFSHDPGGAMMAGMMKLRGPERLFSLGLAANGGAGHGGHQQAGNRQHGAEPRGDRRHGGSQPHGAQHGQHREQRQPHGGPHEHGAGGHPGDDSGHGGTQHDGGMSMQEMSMFTPIKRPALVLAALVGVVLTAMLVALPSWPVAREVPDQDSARRIGHLLMGKYMIAFEGAGLLILLGIYGAVWLARPARPGGARERNRLRAAVDDGPPPSAVDVLEPVGPDHEGTR